MTDNNITFWKDNKLAQEYQLSTVEITKYIQQWINDNRSKVDSWPILRWWPMTIIDLGTWDESDSEYLEELVRKTRREMNLYQ